ncbi:MAG TPA: hypothetical protein VHL57_03185, partial [Flavobacteriales bacterium]|nr:hypothetical protein [Flavobacteriales bacterium]
MEKLFTHLKGLLDHQERCTYDLRANCQVHTGIVAAYRSGSAAHFTDLGQAILHALVHDGIVGAWRDRTGRIFYDSLRSFTTVEQAL